MELNRFVPYGYKTFKEVFDKHFAQVQRYLVHYYFTEEEYLAKRFRKRPRDFSLFIKQLLFDIYIFSGLLLAVLNRDHLFQSYNGVMGEAFGTSEPEKISFCYLIVTIGIYDCLYMSFYWVMNYRLGCASVIIELRATLDREITDKKVKQRFFWFFNVASYQTGLNMKILFIALLALTVQMLVVSMRHFQNGEFTASYIFLIVTFYISCQISFLYTMYTMYALLCGLFFILKIFRYKIRIALEHANQMAVQSKRRLWRLPKFQFTLIHTHRLIRLYDSNIREYNFAMDLLAKLANGWSIINAFRKPEMFNFIFMGVFGLMYFYSHFMGERVAFYKHVSRIMVKKLHRFAVRYSSENRPPRQLIEGRQNQRRLAFQRTNDIRYRRPVLLKTDGLIGFLSSPGCKLGFSYGSQYMYTHWHVVENLLMFVYVLLLVAKKTGNIGKNTFS